MPSQNSDLITIEWRKNLTKCIAFLDRPESPALLRTVIPASITLVELATPPKSVKRFDQLCALLGDGIIGTVWTHGTRQDKVMLAAVEVLPSLIKTLGIGCARYLKVCPSYIRHMLCVSFLSHITDMSSFVSFIFNFAESPHRPPGTSSILRSSSLITITHRLISTHSDVDPPTRPSPFPGPTKRRKHISPNSLRSSPVCRHRRMLISNDSLEGDDSRRRVPVLGHSR